MASSKLLIKNIDRQILFNKKHVYRAALKIRGAHHLRRAESVADFVELVDDRYRMASSYGRAMGYPKSSDCDLTLVEKIINIREKLGKKEHSYRYEFHTFTIYTNSLDVLKQLNKISPDWKFTCANPAPTGVITFKNTPPAQYRAYLKGSRVEDKFKKEFMEAMGRMPGLRPSPSFKDFLTKEEKYYWPSYWLSSTFFLDYDDPAELFVMKLTFGDIIEKIYKLEKK